MRRSEALCGALKSRSRAGVAAALALLSLGLGLGLGGCSIPLSDMPLLGSSETAQEKDADGYLAVNALPAGRQDKTLEPEERSKLEGELVAARARQASAAAGANPAAANPTATAATPK